MKKIALALIALLISNCQLHAQNLAPNPSFEADEYETFGTAGADGFPDGWWKRDYATQETGPAHVRTGSASLKITGSSDGSYISGGDYNIGFDELKPNTKYIMGCWVKTSGLGTGSVRIFHNSDPYVGSYPTAILDEEASDWTKLQVSFTTAEHDSPIKGSIQIGTDLPAGATVWIDDFTFIEVVPYKVVLETSASTLMADGNSFANITAKIYDAYDNFLGVATNTLTFALSGPGQLVGTNPNTAVNGQTGITYKAGSGTGTAVITASSPGLESAQVEISLTDYGNEGVPGQTLDYTADVETGWWANHIFNENSANYNPNILSPDPQISVAEHGGDIQAAIDALPAEGGTIFLPGGQTYYVPATGILLAGKSNIHFISDAGATISVPDGYSGIPQEGGGVSMSMFQIQGQPGDWHDDNYASDYALANRAKNFYFKNLTFDGAGKVTTSLNFWTTRDIVFDNCTFYGATGDQEIHTGAWCDNVWVRGCHFKGSAKHAILWDGTHGSGVLNCTFDYSYYPSAIEFFSNDDCSRDVNDNGSWDPEELRLGNYIVVQGCSFGQTGEKNVTAIGAAVRNILVKDNHMYGNGNAFAHFTSRCSQMVHGPVMPSYEYKFIDLRVVGNRVSGKVNHFVYIKSYNDQNTQDDPRSRCSGYQRPDETADGEPCTSVIGQYQIRGNEVINYTNQDDYVDHMDGFPNDPVRGENLICGNCDLNDEDCTPSPWPGCMEPLPTYTDYGCYTNVGPKYYLDGTKGDDANDGTSPAQAWKSFEHAVENISSASTLTISGGVYTVDNSQEYKIGGQAGGVDANNATIVRAADGQRVIITGDDGKPPRIVLDDDFIRIEGIWFGGDWVIDGGKEFSVSGGGRVDHGREIIGCAFFGYRSVRGGLVEQTFWQHNKFIRTGVANDPPMVYMSGDHGIGYGSHDIFDHNIFINGKGYAINGWHSYHNFMITRNVIANVWGGWIGDGRGSEYQGNVEGSDHLIANNLIINSGENNGFNAATLIASNTHWINNIHIDRSNIAVSHNETYGYETLENLKVNKNAFLNVPISHRGENNVELTEGSEESELGISKTALTNTIDAIDQAFAQGPDVLLNDTALNTHLKKLENFSIPAGSPLSGTGEAWVPGVGTMDIGPGIDAPAWCQGGFWYAFQQQGLRQWDSEGNMYFTRPAFTFSDGSGTTNYRGNDETSDAVDFKALIQPTGATYVSLTWLAFDTEEGGDYVRVYDGPTTESSLLGEYSGSTLPSGLQSTGGAMLLHFQTDDDNTTGKGWKVSYTSDGDATQDSLEYVTSIEDMNIGNEGIAQSEIKAEALYPNPANGQVSIPVYMSKTGKLSISAYDITGQLVDGMETGLLPRGRHIITFPRHKPDWPTGMYFIEIDNGHDWRDVQRVIVY